ncbi:hypothetical protein PTKIN_Ptkin03bG0200300 [Pterospermum kingtungense]
MNQSIVFILVFCLFFHVRAQYSTDPHSGVHLPPSKNFVFGILLRMVILAFVIVHLAYLKFCHVNLVDDDTTVHHQNLHGPTLPRPLLSGVDRTIIESIPFFHFHALKGSKQGLECAVCVSKFEDSDVLRLLPRCKHAFHTNCIDQWLETHSTCPLCRYNFNSEDRNHFIHSINSLRISRNPSNLTEDPNVELFVEREQDDQVQGSSRFTISSSFRNITETGEGGSEDDRKLLLKFNHKITASDVVVKTRWSDVSPSDLLSLNSEMLSFISSKRFSSLEYSNSRRSTGLSRTTQFEKVKEILESKFSIIDRNHDSSSRSFPSSSYTDSNSSQERRSVSEITIIPRLSIRNQMSVVSESGKEERIRRLWLPIMSKTVQWFSAQEGYLQGSKNYIFEILMLMYKGCCKFLVNKHHLKK